MFPSWNIRSFTHSTPARRTPFESNFGIPLQTFSGSSNHNTGIGLQFPISPPEAIFVVPPPSILLESPLIRQVAKLPLQFSAESWSEESEASELSKIMQLSMRQIESRLAQNGIGEEKIRKSRGVVELGELHEALNQRNRSFLLEGQTELHWEGAQAARQNSMAKEDASQRESKGDLLNGGHLRKAKAMFLYARYPNSAYLKSFFPEVTFNRYNTAQLVKWFSNFREYFYVNIEKYTRALAAEGVRSPECIKITPKHVLYRTLLTHYNRGMESEVPPEFCEVVERAALEFFVAIISGADCHSAWKKKIYKNIANFDQPVPEKFRSNHY